MAVKDGAGRVPGFLAPAFPARVVRSLRAQLAIRAGWLAARCSRWLGLGSGGVIGGRVALALAPDLLHRLARGRRVVLVSGTNGKTTTAHMLAAALRTAGPGAHNAPGAHKGGGAAAARPAGAPPPPG